MAQRSHVPKFGNWDGDNVPYTAYFENARKEKSSGSGSSSSSIRINPNDPEQNPEAFSSVPVPPAPATNHHQKQRADMHTNTRRTFSSESSSYDKTPSSNYISKPKHHSNKSSTHSVNPPSPPPNYSADDFSRRSVSVPKFGQWDEQDPKSAQGFTVIFNKVKEEKQIAAAKFPPVPLQTPNNYQGTRERDARKKCCCLF